MSNPRPPRPDEPARCPRCGYDLRGEIARWRTRCPIDGSCNECGLSFEWRNVFLHRRHPWLFEAECGYRPVRRLVLTVLFALWPRKFWRDVRMNDPIALLPPAVLALIGLIVLWGLLVARAVHHEHRFLLTYGTRFREEITGLYWIDLVLSSGINVTRWTLIDLAAPVTLLLAMPLAFLTIPVTLRHARVRPAHVARIGLYALALPLLVATTWAALQLTANVLSLTTLSEWLDPWEWWGTWRTRTYGGNPWLVVLRQSRLPLTLAAATSVWLAWWWGSAITRYLEIPHGRRVVAVLLVMVWVAALCVEFWLRLL